MDAEELRRLAARVAGEVAAYVRDRVGVAELLEVEVVHEGDEGMRIDVESEELIVELLRAEGFRGSVLGEEGGLRRLGGEPIFAVVDPLDGSKNYAAGIPWCAVSIAFAVSRDSRVPRLCDVVAGAVAPVPRMPVFSFARGVGAFEGGSRARRGSRTRMVLGYAETEEQLRLLREYLQLAGRRSVRSLGSASMEILWAALGRVEAFMDVRGKLRVVDVAAAAWFAVEAGARVAVTNCSAPLDHVARVGYVAVTAYDDAWRWIREAMVRSGLGDPEEQLLRATGTS